MKLIGKKITFLVVSISMFWSLPSSAKSLMDMSLEELIQVKVSVASRRDQSVYEAPGLVTVISRDEIQGFQARHLGDVLNRVVGAQLLSPDVFMDQSLSIRGQSITPYNNHVLILQNGRPIRDPISGGFNGTVYAGYPIDAIDHIEVIRGPGSVLYGSTAYSGVVNIVTQEVVENSLTFGVKAGSDNTLNQYFDGRYKNEDFEWMFSLNHLSDDGPTYEFTDYDGTLSSDDFKRDSWGLSSTLKYKDLSANVYVADYRPYSLNGSETWEPGYVNSHGTIFTDVTYSTSLTERSSLDVSYTYNLHRWRGKNDFEDSNSDGVTHQLEATYKWTDGDRINVLVGSGSDKTDWNSGRLIPGNQGSSFAYSQVDYRVFSQSSIIVGAQWNKLEGLDDNISPRLGWISQLSDNLTWKLLYSEAFRKGYPFETNFSVVVFRGNPDLEPEEIKTYETQLIYHTGKTESSLSYFHSKMSNLITREFFSEPSLSPPFYLQYVNGGEWDFWGLEYEGKYQLSSSYYLTASTSYQTNENDSGIKDASLHPNILAKIGLLYKQSSFDLGVFNSYYSKPKETTLVNSSSAQVNSSPESANLLSMKFTTSFNRLRGKGGDNSSEVKLSVEIDNLLNEDFDYPDYPNKRVNSLVPSRGGRGYYLRADYQF